MIHKSGVLTKREMEVLRLISYENTMNDIARLLNLSPHTIISHKRSLLLKLEAKNIAGMIRSGFELRLLTSDYSLC